MGAESPDTSKPTARIPRKTRIIHPIRRREKGKGGRPKLLSIRPYSLISGEQVARHLEGGVVTDAGPTVDRKGNDSIL